MEAFKSRGNGNERTCLDFEDFVFILENRSAIWNEMNQAPENLRKYLKEELK